MKSKTFKIFNRVINITNIVLILMNIAFVIFSIFLIVLLSGFALWRENTYVYNGLKNLNENIVENDSIEFMNLEEKELTFKIEVDITVPSDFIIYSKLFTNKGSISDIYIDNIKISKEEDSYSLPKGEYNLIIIASTEVFVDEYNEIKTVDIRINYEDNIKVSNNFRNIKKLNSESNYIELITSDSKGETIPKIFRTPLIKRLKEITIFTLIFTGLNIIKMYTLFIYKLIFIKKKND